MAHFWTEKGGKWFYKGMFEAFPLPLDWPVWTTWDQASAYLNWRALKAPSLSLAGEAQFQRAALQSCPPSPERITSTIDAGIRYPSMRAPTSRAVRIS